MTKNHDVLNITQAAREINVSRPFLRQLITEGKLPVFQEGNITRIKRSDIDNLFDSGERP